MDEVKYRVNISYTGKFSLTKREKLEQGVKSEQVS